MAKDARIAYRGNEREVVEALPGTAVLAAWDDGTPGVLFSEVGKGAVLYTSATFFGSEPRYYQYLWQVGPMPAGTRELLEGCVAYALEKKGVPRPITLEPSSEDLIADLRAQKGGDGQQRLVLQLLQRKAAYTVDKAKAPRGLAWKGSTLPIECLVAHEHPAVKVKLAVPAGADLSRAVVGCPLQGWVLEAQVAGQTVSFQVPAFVQYTIVVVDRVSGLRLP